MTERPAECVVIHNRLAKCELEVEQSRTYWQLLGHEQGPIDAQQLFESFVFGAKSLPRVKMLLANLRHRFDAYPSSLRVLADWPLMTAETRRAICHWHLQLSDPLYRRFTGAFLVERRQTQRMDITRDVVTRWVDQECAGRWALTTCVQFARKLLAAAFSAGLVLTERDPRPLRYPVVDDLALTYLLLLLRDVQFEGTLLDNPYLASVGLQDDVLERRLKRLPSLRFRRQGELIDFDWQFHTLADWAHATVSTTAVMSLRGAS
jgi:hypothetical protein